jgi:hypothetical protein
LIKIIDIKKFSAESIAWSADAIADLKISEDFKWFFMIA